MNLLVNVMREYKTIKGNIIQEIYNQIWDFYKTRGIASVKCR